MHWIRRRVRLYYWKQWKQPRTRPRPLTKLGADPEEVHMATRSRKGYWRMSANRIVHQALTNRHLEEQGVPNLRTLWIKIAARRLCVRCFALSFMALCATHSLRAKRPSLIGTAGCVIRTSGGVGPVAD